MEICKKNARILQIPLCNFSLSITFVLQNLNLKTMKKSILTVAAFMMIAGLSMNAQEPQKEKKEGEKKEHHKKEGEKKEGEKKEHKKEGEKKEGEKKPQ
ncbi:MAG: hypothetical protein ACXVDK_07375 [Bacteroidia bacterium]